MTRFLAIMVFLALSACQPDKPVVHGYVEGEFIRMAPTSSGFLQTLAVERGQNVKAGDKLFSLDLTELQAVRDAAAADLARTESDYTDLTKGDRPEEIEVVVKQKEQAEATLSRAKKEFDRVRGMIRTGAASQSTMDDAQSSLDNAEAHLQELNARLKTSNLGGRIDKIASAEAIMESAKHTLAQADKKLADAAPLAPVAAYVQDTYFRPGEYVAAGQPIVSLLPPENIKIRFFVPQAIMPKLSAGQKIQISCDGCAETIPAKIVYISQQVEYTPPVIYSVGSRDKLIFLIEAKPEKLDAPLRPGLPVDIDLAIP